MPKMAKTKIEDYKMYGARGANIRYNGTGPATHENVVRYVRVPRVYSK